MELKKCKILYRIFNKFPLPKELRNSAEYEEYLKATSNDKVCLEWNMKKKIKAAGIDYKKYCCVAMAFHLSEDKLSKNNSAINYDSIITYKRKIGQYGIPIHDGGSSFIKINYCPWCGSLLPSQVSRSELGTKN